MALFQHTHNQPTKLWSNLARNAFAIYYLHPIILYPAVYLALSIESSIFVEAAILVIVTAVIAWGASLLILTRWPILRDIFLIRFLKESSAKEVDGCK